MEANAARDRTSPQDPMATTTMPGTSDRRCRRSKGLCPTTQPGHSRRFHMLAGDSRLDTVMQKLGIKVLPTSYISPLYQTLKVAYHNKGFSIKHQLNQAQAKLLALHYVNFGGTPPPQEDIDQARTLMKRLSDNKVLSSRCDGQAYVDRHRKWVTDCEFKQSLISDYLTPIDFPPNPYVNLPPPAAPRASCWHPRPGSLARSLTSRPLAAGQTTTKCPSSSTSARNHTNINELRTLPISPRPGPSRTVAPGHQGSQENPTAC